MHTERDLKEKVIFDTSALLSLELIKLLRKTYLFFIIITTPSVIQELHVFAIHNDELGKKAKNILKKTFVIKNIKIRKKLKYIGIIDNELIALAQKEKLPLITDDLKLYIHAKNLVTLYHSTFLFFIFIEFGVYTKHQMLEKLELLYEKRDWKNNITYLITKKELEEI